jgi:hypothetical protein
MPTSEQWAAWETPSSVQPYSLLCEPPRLSTSSSYLWCLEQRRSDKMFSETKTGLPKLRREMLLPAMTIVKRKNTGK